MKTTKFILTSLFIAMFAYALQGKAEDIDLYSAAASVAGSGSLPNVLFIVDNAANFNASAPSCTYDDGGGTPSLGATSGGMEQCALNNAINALPVQANGTAVVNIGILVYNASGMDTLYGCNSSAKGGCLMVPFMPMTAANKTSIKNTIKAWTSGTVQSNNEATAQTMQEAWAYYAGKTGMSGTPYISTANTGCQKNFVVFIGNAINNSGTPGDASATPGTELTNTITANTALTAAQKTMLGAKIQIPAGAYGTSAFTCSPNPYSLNLSTGHGDNTGEYADEWARYMYSVDLSSGKMPANKRITSYTIGVLSSACKADYPALLTSMAIQGSGKYFPTNNGADIKQAILRILNEVQAVNSVFASSSLPVSVNTQGTYLNQIFMGMFRPDSGGAPRWNGNLKQYQLGYDPTLQKVFLADATGNSAVSSAGTGFLSPNAASFWTCSNSANTQNQVTPYNVSPYSTTSLCSTDPAVGFWANQPNGIGLAWDLPDGEVVEKGGAAQMLRLANLTDTYTATPGSTTNPRKLYTYCPSGSGCVTALADTTNVFDTSNAAITDTMLGTGPRTITSITSAATVPASGTVPGSSGATTTVSITALAKSGSTVTATVSAADIVKLAVASSLKIATGATKYDCNPCTVTAVNTISNTFTYTNSGGSGTPTLPSTATIYSNFVTVTNNNHGLTVGQTLTLTGCTTYTTLNGTISTVTAVTTNTFTLATSVALVGVTSDTGCSYTPNTAFVTTATAHGFPSGGGVVIAGASPVGYNGSWIITATGSTTFTYQYTVAAPLASFSAGGATASRATTNRDTLTKWVRGEDNYGDEASLCPPGTTAGTGNCPNPAVNIRPSLHGDVLHSRPVVVNYGGSTGVIVYYGDNGGVFHAVNGNQVNPSGSALPSPGNELWGFIPTEFYGKFLRLHDNSPVLQMPTTLPGITPTPQKKDYFADGPASSYQVINGNGVTTKAYLYLAMRRGGRFIYALDVTDPTNPTFMWKHSNTDTGFGELGQTWSQPQVAQVSGYTNPVLIFGAGYDPAEDAEAPTADTMGRGIFILDAVTGNLVWSASPGGTTSCSSGTTPPCHSAVTGMNYSIPSDIALLDRNADGKIDRLYVGDVGGNVWRVDLNPVAGNTPNYWQVEKLAALGCSSGACASGTTPRKIFYPPEVIFTQTYDVVFVATGDREHPLYTDPASTLGTPLPFASSPPYGVSACGINNRAYLLKDLATGMDGSGLTTITEMTGATANLFDASATNWNGTLSGYYIKFDTCEKAVNAPLLAAGSIYFGTNKAEAPNNQKCEETLGEATGYSLSPFTGSHNSYEFEGGGLPPSPVSGIVNITDPTTGKIVQVPFCIGCVNSGEDNNNGNNQTGCTSSIESCYLKVIPKTSRTRTYWYMENK